VIKHHLDSTETLSNELNSMCINLKTKIEKADFNMKAFIEKTSSLERNKTSIVSSKTQIDYFLSKYHMNSLDIDFLTSKANLNVISEFSLFLSKLNKLKESFYECQRYADNNAINSSSSSSSSSALASNNLLSSSNPTAGGSGTNNPVLFSNGLIQFELLEILGNQKENAYSYLFNWIKEKCELLSDYHHSSTAPATTTGREGSTGNIQTSLMNILSEDPDLVHRLQVAISYLKDVPAYFQQCQDLLIPAKRNILINRFMISLTQGESSSNASANEGGR
jgi:hypothetical protein